MRACQKARVGEGAEIERALVDVTGTGAFLAIAYQNLSAWQVLKKSVRGNFWARTSLKGRFTI